jgi:hypothetical protein
MTATTFPGSPRLLKAGLVLLDPTSNRVLRIIALQYNPETLSRSLQVQGVQEGGERSQALRLTGPPQETYTLEATIDAIDQMEDLGAADKMEDQSVGEDVRRYGILPQLAALEALLYPPSRRLVRNNSLASVGTLEIIPAEAPLTVFVWSKNRVLPVRLTEFSVTEEAFDPDLNPIRAKVNLGLRVLTVNDLGFDHRGGNLFLDYHRQLERLAERSRGSLESLGINGF